MSLGPGRTDQLVAGIRNQRRPGIADERDRFGSEARDDGIPLCLARMVIVVRKPRLRPGMRQELGADPFVLSEHQIRSTKRVCRTRSQVTEIPDRRGHDVEARKEALGFHFCC